MKQDSPKSNEKHHIQINKPKNIHKNPQIFMLESINL